MGVKRVGFDWWEFLELAQHLQGQSGPRYSVEASNRSAVSRAYYAAFCSARNFAQEQQGFQVTHTAKDHARLVEHFKQQGGQWIRLAATLERLRRWRNECDYQDCVEDLQWVVASALRDATKVSQVLQGR